MNHNNLPRVVLVGRVNVGKSTLFNRLALKTRALAHDSEGVTRDPLYDTCSWQGYDFLVVDTGGAQYKTRDALHCRVFQKSMEEIEKADIVVLVVDGTAGFSEDDYTLINDIRKQNRPLIVAINKSDIPGDDTWYEAQGLGFDKVVKVSAAHGRGIEDLLAAIIEVINERKITPKELTTHKSAFQVTFLGRPNVGKSSIMNELVQHERSLVCDMPGTTREAVLDQINFFNTTIEIVDTPGVRRPRAVSEKLEEMMVSSTMFALSKANIVLLVLDATTPHLLDQDLKLAFYAFQDLYKGVIVIWNKTDLVEISMEDLVKNFTGEYRHLFSKVPSLNTSCLTGKNIGKIIPKINELWERFSQKLPSEEIQSLFIQRLEKTPLMCKQEKLVLYRAYMLQTAPPTIMLQVNNPKWVGESQRAFFENILREKYDLLGVPIKWIIRKK